MLTRSLTLGALVAVVQAAEITIKAGGSITLESEEASSTASTSDSTSVATLTAQLAALQASMASTSSQLPFSCADVLRFTPAAPDGVYNISTLSGVQPLYCNMQEFGWPAALVYRKAQPADTFFDTLNLAGLNSDGETAGAYGEGPPMPDATAMGTLHKLSDLDVESVRTTIPNNLMVRVIYDGSVLGKSFHKASCPFVSEGGIASHVPAQGACSSSTLLGPRSVSYQTTGTDNAINGISRWYVANDFGYIFPSIHIGSATTGMTSHGQPDQICRFVKRDDTFKTPCGKDAVFEVWAL